MNFQEIIDAIHQNAINNADLSNIDLTQMETLRDGRTFSRITILRGVMENNQSVGILFLNNCSLTASHALEVSTIIASSRTLKEVQLEGNKLGDHGAGLIGRALLANQSIAILSLEDNQITDRGLNDGLGNGLAVALHTNRTLESLYLTGNPIGDPGASALAIMLQTNRTLAAIYLEKALITDRGVQYFQQSLAAQSEHRVLDRLALADNDGVTDAAFVGLVRAFDWVDFSRESSDEDSNEEMSLAVDDAGYDPDDETHSDAESGARARAPSSFRPNSPA